jgi:hypothetical protein
MPEPHIDRIIAGKFRRARRLLTLFSAAASLQIVYSFVKYD